MPEGVWDSVYAAFGHQYTLKNTSLLPYPIRYHPRRVLSFRWGEVWVPLSKEGGCGHHAPNFPEPSHHDKLLIANNTLAGDRKQILPEEKYNATNFLTLVDFEGLFKYSPLFYGWYTNQDFHKGYRLPFAYFITGLMVYAYSFFATLRKMAENSRMSKLSEKDDECIFSWKVFTAWDYMIGNAETAHNKVASIVMGFKEALLEEAEKRRDPRKWRVVSLRILVNTIVLAMLSFSAYAVVMVVKRSREPEGQIGLWRRNEITFVMTSISFVFPMVFEVLGLLEQYHPRKQLRVQLTRIMVLNLLNLYSLILALFEEISTMTTRLEQYKTNLTATNTTSLIPTTIEMNCYEECTYFEEDENKYTSTTALVTALAVNVTLGTFTKFGGLVTEKTTLAPPANYYLRPFVLPGLSNNYTDNTTTINENYTLPPDFENITFFNSSIFELNNETSNYSILDESTHPSNTSISNWANAFVDYLSYILFNSVYQFDNMSISLTNETFNDTEELTYSPHLDVTQESALTSSDWSTDYDYNRFESDSTTEDTYSSLPYEVDLSTTEGEEFSTIPVNMTRKNCTTICPIYLDERKREMAQKVQQLNYTSRRDLRKLCWETMFGQELVKLTVMDLVFTILSTMGMDCIRAVFVRYMNRCWCWDLEKRFPQYGDFKVAENILHLVNNQGMVWMGMFFSPGIVVLNTVKLYVLMYFRAWIVLSCNVPHEVIFRASRSNNFYYALLLMMLFLCVLPVGYAIVCIKPSWHCGPFSEYDTIYQIFTKTIKGALPQFEEVLNYIASPGTVIPLLVLLILIIYYLVSLTAALREANNDLKIQLRRERTEERRKMFQIADRRRRGGSGGSGESNPYNKWKTLLERLPSGKSIDETPKLESEDQQPPKEEKAENNKTKDFFTKLMKKALGKSSTSEEDVNQNVDDGTDTDPHESLPEDMVSVKDSKSVTHKPLKPTMSSGSADLQRAIASAFVAKRNQKRLENLRGSTDSSETKHVQIQQHLPKHSSSKRECFDARKKLPKKQSFEAPSTSRQDSGSSLWSDNIPVITISKTDSAENILNSPKNQVKDKASANGTSQSPHNENSRDVAVSKDKNSEHSDSEDKFKPKIKYALRKQSSEIDEDMIFHFNRDAEGAIYGSPGFDTVHEELSPTTMPSAPSYEELVIDASSSDDTEARESSQDTILNAPGSLRTNQEGQEEISVQDEHKNVKQESTVSCDTQRSNTDGSSTQTESSTYYKDSTLS